MTIFVFEHLVGGGACDEELPAALADAGAAMWRAVTEDFSAAGHEVLTCAGRRTDTTRGGKAMATIAPPAELAEVMAAAERCDAALIIAPETGGVSLGWARQIAGWRARSLGSSPNAIELCSDKFALCTHLAHCGIAVPSTIAGEPARLLTAGCLGLNGGNSWILKPRDGAGCERTFLVRDPIQFAQLREQLDVDDLAAPTSPHDGWILQPFHVGQPASVSFMVHGSSVMPLRAGAQLIDVGNELTYRGGEIPLAEDLARRAIALAEKAVDSVPGLRGFVGVDLVLGDGPESDVVIEINPRVTMSYCGLRRLCGVNLASMMLDPKLEPSWRAGRVRFDNTGRVEEH